MSPHFVGYGLQIEEVILETSLIPGGIQINNIDVQGLKRKSSWTIPILIKKWSSTIFLVLLFLGGFFEKVSGREK